MTAVIYARYSSDSQREASIEGQLRDCKAYAEKNGITVVGTYIDRAYSAKTDDRPDFQRMIKDSGKKIFDVVLVWKLDRFARNRYDAVNYKYQRAVSAKMPSSASTTAVSFRWASPLARRTDCTISTRRRLPLCRRFLPGTPTASLPRKSQHP